MNSLQEILKGKIKESLSKHSLAQVQMFNIVAMVMTEFPQATVATIQEVVKELKEESKTKEG